MAGYGLTLVPGHTKQFGGQSMDLRQRDTDQSAGLGDEAILKGGMQERAAR